MADRRLRLDVAAIGFLAAGLAVALSVFSHDPADAPGATVHPRHESPSNFMGTPGAWLAQALYDTLGIAVYILLASWFALVLLLFLRRSSWNRFRRLSGWLLLIAGTAAAADYVGPTTFPVSLLGGTGGTLGAWLTGHLEAAFPPAARVVILASILLLGLVLALDDALRQLAWTSWKSGGWLTLGAWRLGCWLQKVSAERERPWRGTAVAPLRRASEAPAALQSSDVVQRTEEEIPIRHHDEAIATLGAAQKGTLSLSRGMA